MGDYLSRNAGADRRRAARPGRRSPGSMSRRCWPGSCWSSRHEEAPPFSPCCWPDAPRSVQTIAPANGGPPAAYLEPVGRRRGTARPAGGAHSATPQLTGLVEQALRQNLDIDHGRGPDSRSPGAGECGRRRLVAAAGGRSLGHPPADQRERHPRPARFRRRRQSASAFPARNSPTGAPASTPAGSSTCSAATSASARPPARELPRPHGTGTTSKSPSPPKSPAPISASAPSRRKSPMPRPSWRGSNASNSWSPRRTRGGLVTGQDLEQQRSERSTAAAAIPALQAQAKAEIHALGVLTGQAPEALSASPIGRHRTACPPPSDAPPACRRTCSAGGRISALAERDLAAATADIGVAVADLYPRISLTAAPALVSTALGSLLEWGSRSFSAGAALDWPIFDGGRRRANIEVRNARAGTGHDRLSQVGADRASGRRGRARAASTATAASSPSWSKPIQPPRAPRTSPAPAIAAASSPCPTCCWPSSVAYRWRSK